MMSPMLILEAAASIALSHPDGCTCLTCKAASGDGVSQALLIDEVYRLSVNNADAGGTATS